MAAQLNLNTDKIEKIKERVQDANEELVAQGTTISEIAALLEGKSVPGGSGSGGSVETCTVEILALGPVMTTTFYFIDADGAVQRVYCSPTDMMMGTQLVVKGNTSLASDMNISSVQEPEGGAIHMGPYCYYITGDATVYIGG